jgi:MFS superfamily sulfate permease-like transporter
MSRRFLMVLLFTLLLGITFGCQTTYYAFWEKLGKEKRHLLKDNVEKARTEQEKASEEFKDALTRVKELYGFKGGELEDFYNRLRDDYESCEKRAQAVRNRIDAVEQIAVDLFKEWETEINNMENETFKSKSAQSLRATKARYARLNDAMVKAESKMGPVLKQLEDYVLYLKHNLNAQAVGALKQEVDDIEVEVETLIQDIAKSIQEADAFLESFE